MVAELEDSHHYPSQAKGLVTLGFEPLLQMKLYYKCNLHHISNIAEKKLIEGFLVAAHHYCSLPSP